MGAQTRIGKKIAFKVREDGLYHRIDAGPWKRIGRRIVVINVAFESGELELSDLPISSVRDKNGKALSLYGGSRDRKVDGAATSAELENAARVVQEKLKGCGHLVDAHRHKRTTLGESALMGADGYLVRIPGAGWVNAIKSEALARWISGSVSLRAVVDLLASRGQLVRGADGKRTRQVEINGVGRKRFYCFKADPPADAQDHAPTAGRLTRRIQAGTHHDRAPPTQRRKQGLPAWTDDPEPALLGVVTSRSSV